jgi:hypothetical protein
MLHTYIQCLLLKEEDLPWSRRHYLVMLASFLMAAVGAAFYLHAGELAPPSTNELAIKLHASLMEMKHLDSSTIYWQIKLCFLAYAVCSLPYFIMVVLWFFYLGKRFVFWRFLSLSTIVFVVIGINLFWIAIQLPYLLLLVKLIVWGT